MGPPSRASHDPADHAARQNPHNLRAFQRVLAGQPLMRNVPADLCPEPLAATFLAFRLAP